MNLDQIAQQAVFLLNNSNFKWPTGLQEPALGHALVGPVPDKFFSHDFVSPCVIVHAEAAKDEGEHPADLCDEPRLTLEIYAENAGGQASSEAVVGGHRADTGSSRGRGVLELEPLVRKQVFTALGLTARLRTIGAQPTRAGAELNRAIAQRSLEAALTRIPALPDYAPVRRLLNNGSGGGNVAVTFAAAPNRYDLIGYSWARAPGGTPPSDPTAGTFVANTAATSFADAPGAGTWSYSFWWAYDLSRDPWTGNGAAAPNAWSSQQSAQAGLVYLPASITLSV